MAVLGSGQRGWKRQACPEFISPCSEGAGLRKHIANSSLAKKKKRQEFFPQSKQHPWKRPLGRGVVKKCQSSCIHLLSAQRAWEADLPGDRRGGLVASLSSGSANLGPHRKQLGAQVCMWSGETGTRGETEEGQRRGQRLVLLSQHGDHQRPDSGPLPAPSPRPAIEGSYGC